MSKLYVRYILRLVQQYLFSYKITLHSFRCTLLNYREEKTKWAGKGVQCTLSLVSVVVPDGIMLSSTDERKEYQPGLHFHDVYVLGDFRQWTS